MSMISQYKFNDNAANAVVVDSVGGRNCEWRESGAAHNTSGHSVAGKINTALDFDGASNYAYLSNEYNLSTLSAFSICGWLKIDGLPTVHGHTFGIYYHKLTLSPWTYFSCFVSGTNDRLYIKIYDSTFTEHQIGSDDALAIDTWYWICFTWDGSNMNLYINNVLQDTDISDAISLRGGTSSSALFGNSSSADSSWLDGQLDDWRLYSHALTSAERAEIYNSGSGSEKIFWDSVTATAYNVELRDKDGNLKQYLTPWVKSCSWEWNRIGGCGRCRISLAMEYRKIEFQPRDDIQIRIKSGTTSKLVYRGWVYGTIPSLKTGQDITLDVRGYFDLLDLIVVQNAGDEKTYTEQNVADIVDDVIDTFVVPNSDITKGTIDSSSFSADSLSFKTTVAEVLRTCAELIGQVEYGVDEDLVFFWRTESETLTRKFFVGNNVEMLERRMDLSQMLNKIYFEGGEVNGVPYIATAEVSDSQDVYGIAEGIITNSSITTSSVADQYLGAILKERSSPKFTVRAKIPNTTLRLEDSIPLGAVAVYDAVHDENIYTIGEAGDGGSDLTIGATANGGSGATIGAVYQGQVDKISYELSDTSERMNIEIVLGGSLLETSAKIEQIELLLSNLRQR